MRGSFLVSEFVRSVVLPIFVSATRKLEFCSCVLLPQHEYLLNYYNMCIRYVITLFSVSCIVLLQ